MNDDVEEKEPQTIIEFQVSNVQCLKAVHLHPDGKPIVVIAGKNGQGKSSVLNSIVWALQGKRAMPPEVVRKGELYADMLLKTQAWEIQRRETVDGKGSLEVRYRGIPVTKAPQGALSALGNGIAFDPEEFMRMDAKQQAETLRALVGLDLSEIDDQCARAFAERTDLTRDLKRAEIQLQGMPVHAGIVANEDVQALLGELRLAREANQQRSQLAQETAQLQARRANLLEQMDRLRMELEGLNNRVQEQELRLSLMAIVPEEPFLQRLARAEKVNQCVRQNIMQQEQQEVVRSLRDQVQVHTQTIEDLRLERARRIAACAMPIPDLSFNEAGLVTYQGILLAQCNTATQLKVGVSVGLAAHPEFAVVLIRNASLLDDDSVAQIAAMVQAAGAQIWLERVSDVGEDIIIIEDGMVKE